MRWPIRLIWLLGIILVGVCCTRKDKATKVFQNKGSDTMVNIAQAWAEAYHEKNKDIAIAVTGGGSGTGIAALINGTVDLANSSRMIKPEEVKSAKEQTGKQVIGSVVGLDALSVFVHRDNPLSRISIPELACIYGEGGTCGTWRDLGISQLSGCRSNEIVRVSRQSNSGTYQYFREAILPKDKDFKLGSRDLHGSKDVVDLVEHTPCAIGYTGMGYLTKGVKALCLSKVKGGPCVLASERSVVDRSYPIARELYLYTLGEPTGELKAYVDWIKGPEGQKIISEMGYIPMPKKSNS